MHNRPVKKKDASVCGEVKIPIGVCGLVKTIKRILTAIIGKKQPKKVIPTEHPEDNKTLQSMQQKQKKRGVIVCV